MYARNSFGQYDIVLGDLVVAIGNRLNTIRTSTETIVLNRIDPDDVLIVFARDWSSVTIEARRTAAGQ
jgi:hypothetical protein